MKALILVGGYGTRLRPLTLSLPKPLVQFANKPMVVHQIEALKQVGVTEVILAVSYQPKVMEEQMKKYEQKYNIKISYSVEEIPLGTAGPLALAKERLLADGNETFFVFNSDVICEYPLQHLLQYHKAHGKEGTIMVTKVEEPSKYGVVVTESGGEGTILKFVEKPKVFVGNRINAGIYVFNKEILKRIPDGKQVSIEKEVFPHMAAEGQLFAQDLAGFWMDVGQPRDYLTGMTLYLTSLANKKDPQIAAPPQNNSYSLIDNTVIISPSAQIGKGCVIGPNVVIGENCVIGDGVRLQRCVVMDNTTVGGHSWIHSSIIGWNCKIGRWVRIENTSVLAEDVVVADEISINGGQILPHKGVNESILKPGTILM